MPEEENSKVFVGSLPWSVNDDQLRELFSSVEGVKVVEAKVIMERENPSRSRGFGFVTLEDEEQAKKAIQEMNGKEIDGRTIVVNLSRPRRDNDRN